MMSPFFLIVAHVLYIVVVVLWTLPLLVSACGTVLCTSRKTPVLRLNLDGMMARTMENRCSTVECDCVHHL